jgi:hypothetical protein
MQRTADFHDQIANARLPQAAGVVDDTAALDTAVDVLDAHAATREAPICGFLGAREGAAPRLPGRPDDLDLIECERQAAEILDWRSVNRKVPMAAASFRWRPRIP